MQSTKAFSRRVYFIRDSSQPHLILGIQVIYLLLVFFSSIVLYMVVQLQPGRRPGAPAERPRHAGSAAAHPHLPECRRPDRHLRHQHLLHPPHRGTRVPPAADHARRGDGNLAQFAQFRKEDELQELAAGFDEMVVGLNRRVYGLRGRADAILKASSSAALSAQVTGLTHEANQLVADLARFRLLPRRSWTPGIDGAGGCRRASGGARNNSPGTRPLGPHSRTSLLSARLVSLGDAGPRLFPGAPGWRRGPGRPWSRRAAARRSCR